MLVHTSPYDLDTISQRLVEKYPQLKYAVDSAYISDWMCMVDMFIMNVILHVLGFLEREAM